ncbi:AsmA-like C-terminal region-containing protein [Wolbachia endosymbiont of Anopheles demeilloni]|uniref:AsmA-like C-terminal region-containing protein n=1 Tax=Wolbachia endosymbiont of Anopheles demeilloni TaxID=2748871 RepID=UPI001BD917D5|nr:AsmA-like C-terminal region-containing protein [Wolbachia endosymbiont of Anopheles demeilloni]UIP92255.1 AsmA-like C-terminal region-containing protein [Wolbachia endosymbiont of Anopheles demeilloni]
MKLSLYAILSISLLLILMHVAATFKDWSGYREYIVKELEKTYDAKVHVGGKIEVSLITPKLTIYNLYVQYNKNKEQKLSDLISAKKIEIRPSLLSLFSFSLQPKSISFLGMKSNKENLLNIINTKANDNIVDILIKDSQISFNADTINIKEVAIKKNKQFFGEVQIGDNNYDFSGKVNVTKNNVHISVDSNFANLLFKGNRNQQGNLTMTINNSSGSVSNLAKIINLSFLSYIIPSENIEISSNINLNESEFTATDLKIESKSMQGTGIIQNDRKSDHTNINISFSKVDLKNGSHKTTDMKGLLESFREVVPKNLSLDFYMEASNIQYQNRILDKFHATLKFANGKINVDTLLQFPGINNISRLSGRVSNNGNLSEFNGDILIKGESFISHILPSIKMQEREKSQFTASSKLYLAPRILSLSDIRLLNNKESWQGSIKVNYTKKHNMIDSKFSIHNINIDKYDYSLFSKVQWLKNLKYDVNIRTSVKDSIFNGTKIEDLDFSLKIQENKLVADKIKLFGENFDITGNVKILVDQKYTKPLLEVNLTGNKFNGNIFKLPKLLEVKRNSKNEINQIQWSTKQLNFLDEKGDFDANVQIKTTEFKIGQNVLKDFNLDTVIRNNTITIKQISYILEHGKMFFQGYLKAGSIHTKFSIANLDTKEVIGVNNINGKISLSGEIKTQGTSFDDWASNLSGNVNFQAQKIEFTNVDFNSFITKLLSSKNKPEISKLAYVDICNGSTLFENINGKVSINSGVCSTSSQFSTDQASGSISSNLILSNFSLTSIFRLFFILPNHNSPLYIEAHLDGPIWCPKMSFDVDQIYNTLVSKKNS